MSGRLFSYLFAFSFALGCNGPFLLLPGGELSGEERPAPQTWSFAKDSGPAELQTLADDPYSINLVYTVVGGQLYLNAGDTETQWVKNMIVDPLVRLRVDGVIYDARAERVTDRSTIDAFGRAWTRQSMFRRDPSQFDEVWIYRLIPR